MVKSSLVGGAFSLAVSHLIVIINSHFHDLKRKEKNNIKIAIGKRV
jgi:hypothetical protein